MTAKCEAALVIAREALRQIARDRAAARPTAYYIAKARFALDRINVALREPPKALSIFRPTFAVGKIDKVT